MALETLAAITTIAGGIMGASGAKQSARAQRRAAKANAALTFDQRMEEIRRQEIEFLYAEELATARAASSGVEEAGTPRAYLDYLRQEHGARTKFAQQQAGQERRAMEMGAPSSSTGNLLAASELLSGITAGIGTYSQIKASKG